MIATFWCPASSSASRIAATRPSIMSDGATMSAPASAWTSAWSTSTFDRVVVDDVAGLVDEPVVAVRGVGIERDVGQDADLRHRVLDRLDRAADEIVGVERLLARPRCGARSGVFGNRATHGMPRSAASRALAASRSTLQRRRREASRSAPRNPEPSQMNSGQMKSLGCSRCSASIARIAGDERPRRMRR